jgi:hypothetical protein
LAERRPLRRSSRGPQLSIRSSSCAALGAAATAVRVLMLGVARRRRRACAGARVRTAAVADGLGHALPRARARLGHTRDTYAAYRRVRPGPLRNGAVLIGTTVLRIGASAAAAVVRRFATAVLHIGAVQRVGTVLRVGTTAIRLHTATLLRAGAALRCGAALRRAASRGLAATRRRATFAAPSAATTDGRRRRAELAAR